MPQTLQKFLVRSIPKATDDLVKAFLRLPEDKRGWSPAPTSRTALDQVAEIALLNGNTADLIAARKWTMGEDFSEYIKAKAELATGWDNAKALLDKNTARVLAAIEVLPDDDLEIEIAMPWGPSTLAQIAAYPYWNACYHEGQINYIASILGCLE